MDLAYVTPSSIEAGLRAWDQLVYGRPTWEDPVPEPRTVLDAVTAGDADRAGEEMNRLLERAWREAAEVAERDAPAAATAAGERHEARP
jgi:DNA-binding GntR family transcriptional regulator